MPAPRPLSFASVAEAPDEAARLRAAGYEKRGNWDLRQIADHCAEWIELALSGDYRPPAVMKPVFFVLRKTFGPKMLRKVLATGAIKAGLPTDPKTVPPPADARDGTRDDAAEAAAVDRLRTAADRLAAHAGPVPDSPLYGPMTADEAKRLHAIHCAHHLGFLEPAS